jgi:Mg2+ and Co2+ transporter CorA
MEILVYRKGCSEDSGKAFTGRTICRSCLQDQSAVIWVDMESPTEEDERVLLDVFKFHPLTVEDCRENRHYPKIEEFDGLHLLHRARRDAPTPVPIASTRSSWTDFSVPTTSSLITTTCFAASIT